MATKANICTQTLQYRSMPFNWFVFYAGDINKWISRVENLSELSKRTKKVRAQERVNDSGGNL